MFLTAQQVKQLLAPYQAIAYGYWGAEFSIPEVLLTQLGSDAGRCEGYRRIAINEQLLDWPLDFQETVVHEYAHAVIAWLAEHVGGIAAEDEYHGRLWRSMMATFGYPNAQPDHCLPLGDCCAAEYEPIAVAA